MKRTITIIVAALTLSACATTHVPDLGQAPPAKMPELPQVLKERATKLPPITDPTLGGIHSDGAQVDMRYNDLALRYNSLLAVYECVKQALDKQDADAAKACLNG